MYLCYELQLSIFLVVLQIRNTIEAHISSYILRQNPSCVADDRTTRFPHNDSHSLAEISALTAPSIGSPGAESEDMVMEEKRKAQVHVAS
jgi:hypothetical protein